MKLFLIYFVDFLSGDKHSLEFFMSTPVCALEVPNNSTNFTVGHICRKILCSHILQKVTFC